MARGAGRKVVSANGSVRTREMTRRSRNQPLKCSSHSDLCTEGEVGTSVKETESHQKSGDFTPLIPNNQILPNGKAYKLREFPDDKQYTKCDTSVIYQTSTTTCIVTRKSSQILDSGEAAYDELQISENCDIQSQVYSSSGIPVSNKHCSVTEKCVYNTETVASAAPAVVRDDGRASGLILELLLHFNTVIYCMSSLSTNHLLKDASHNLKTPLEMDPLTVKVICTLSLGVVADFVSPVAALVLPQTTCLLSGILLNLQVSPQLTAFLASNLPHFSSGLIGTQLLMRLSKTPDGFAAALSRINCIYCLIDLFNPWLLQMANWLLGDTFSYQVMIFSSGLGLVGVLYLFHTNPINTASSQKEQNVFKSIFLRLFLSIPAALLLPSFQHVLSTDGRLNRFGLAGVVIAGLAFQQAVMVPTLQLFSNPGRIIGMSSVLLTLLYLSLVITEATNVGLILLIILYGLVGIVQNFVVSFLVNSYRGIPGLLLATNLVLHLIIRYFAAQVSEDMKVFSLMERECLNAQVWFKDNASETFLRLSDTALGVMFVWCDRIYMKIVYVVGSISSLLLLLFAKNV